MVLVGSLVGHSHVFFFGSHNNRKVSERQQREGSENTQNLSSDHYLRKQNWSLRPQIIQLHCVMGPFQVEACGGSEGPLQCQVGNGKKAYPG